jgi:hypothetical protein
VFNNPVIYADPTGLWTWKGAFGGLISGIFVGAGVGAGAGTWLAGIGAIPGAIAGGIGGGIFGFVAGGIWGDSVGQATGTGDFTGGALCGVGGGVAGGLLGPIIWSIYTGVFWTSNFAIWLGLGAAPATQIELERKKETLEYLKQLHYDLASRYANDPRMQMMIRDSLREVEEEIRQIEQMLGR